MKEHYMIVGAEILNSNELDAGKSLMKIKLIPLTTVKKVTRIQEIMSGGHIEEMIDAATEHQRGQSRSEIYITVDEWIKQGYKIAKHVTLELKPDDTTGGIK